MYKIFVFAPVDATDKIIDAASEAGAGKIGNYSHCAFITSGVGNWKSLPGSHPTIGEVGKMSREPENKIEMLCSDKSLQNIVTAIRRAHPYESPEIDVVKLEQK